MDDAQLVRQVLQGNLGAYGELVVRYAAKIAALCRAYVPKQQVDDLVQEAFLRGLDSVAGLREPEKFGSWLCGIARNLCRDWLKDRDNRHGPLDAAPEPEARPEPADGNDRADRIAAVKKCVRQLPEELREVMEIYYSGGGVTYPGLAALKEVSFGQINKWLTKARRMVRTCLEREDPRASLPA